MTLDFLSALAIAISIVVGFVLQHKRNKKLISLLSDKNRKLDKHLAKKTSELASVRVKHGQAWEVFLPLMEVFEEELGDRNEAVFLGQPIDLIYFKQDEIVFAEVKTGNSRLSQRQRNIKKLVQEGKIRWAEVNDDLRFASPATDQINSVDTMTTQPKNEPEKHSQE